MHWKKLFNNRFLGSWDLEGRGSVTVTIEKVVTEKVQNTQGQEEDVPVAYFAGSKTGKGMILNRTNARAIANMHGTDIAKWTGKKIEIGVEVVNAFGQQTEALRVLGSTSRKSRQSTAAAAAVLNDESSVNNHE